MCKNIDVTSRQYSPCHTSGRNTAPNWISVSGSVVLPVREASRNTITLTAMINDVTGAARSVSMKCAGRACGAADCGGAGGVADAAGVASLGASGTNGGGLLGGTSVSDKTGTIHRRGATSPLRACRLHYSRRG